MGRNAFILCSAIICAAFLHSASAKLVNFTDCGSKGAKLVSLDLSPCDKEPCNFKIGTKVVGTLTFIAKEYISSGRVKAFAVIDGITIPVPLPEIDACHDYGLKCPINNGQTAKFVIEQEIEQGFPITKLALKGEMTDPQQNMVFCFQVPLQISAAKDFTVIV